MSVASYSAVIEVSVKGQQALEKLDASARKINDLLTGIKQQRNIFDGAVGTKQVRELKKNLEAVVSAFANAGDKVNQFRVKIGDKTQTVNMYSKTLAGLNHQLTTFSAIANNATVGTGRYRDAIRAADMVTVRLLQTQGSALKVQTELSTKLVTPYLNLNKTLPQSVQGLQFYKQNLTELLARVEAGSADFMQLTNAINSTNRELRFYEMQATGKVRPSAGYAAPIGPQAAPGTALAAGLQAAGMPTFAAGVRGIGQGLTPGKRAGTLKGAVGSAIIGGGFPLLFGQGPEAAVGGAVGGALGGLVGGPMGFALSIAGTAIGELLAKQKELVNEVRNEAIARGQVYTAMQQQLDSRKQFLQVDREISNLSEQAAIALTAGNESLAIELELKQQLLNIDKERRAAIREAVSDPNVAAGGQMAEQQQLINAEAALAAEAAKRLAAQKQVTAEYNNQRAAIQHQAQLVQGQIALEKQRVTMSANLVQARSQAEIAVNNVILQRLEHELQSTTNAQKRAQIIQGIYNLEVANARATYQATVAQIASQAQLVQLAYREQQAKYASLQVELALAKARGQGVIDIARAIELQQQAIGLAAENLQYTNMIASEQLRGADATYKAAVQAAELKAQTQGAAQAAGQFASSMSAGAMAVEKAAVAAETVRSRTTLTGETTLQTVRRFEAALQRYEENQAYGIKTEFPNVQEYISGVRAGGFVSPANVSERTQALSIALAKYQAGQSTQGSVNPQVNITTGPVMQMGGARYVTQNDLVSATQSAARQGANMAIGSLRSNPSIRRSVGLAR